MQLVVCYKLETALRVCGPIVGLSSFCVGRRLHRMLSHDKGCLMIVVSCPDHTSPPPESGLAAFSTILGLH